MSLTMGTPPPFNAKSEGGSYLGTTQFKNCEYSRSGSIAKPEVKGSVPNGGRALVLASGEHDRGPSSESLFS